MDFTLAILLGGLVLLGVLLIPVIVARFLTTVDAGTIRLVTGRGKTTVYKGPGKAIEIPIFTTGTTIPAKAINIDLEVADQTADVDRNGQPRPIKVRVLASAIVSVGDSNEMIQTAANRFFSKPVPEQTSTLTDLLTSTGRRAINLLHHDELFNSRVGSYDEGATAIPVKPGIPAEEDDRLAIIIKSSCSRELQDLGLVFNSLNIKEVQSEVAEARRRQSAVEAKANADIVTADQERRAKEAQLGAEQAVNDKMRDLDRRRADNAAQIAEAETAKQVMLGGLREAELRATQIAKATADSEQLKIQTVAAAEAEAMRIRMLAAAQADAIRLVNDALAAGGNGYLKLKQLEMLPAIAPRIADALAEAKMVTFSSDGQGAPSGTVDQISNVIQMVLATQLVQNTPLSNASSKPDQPLEQPAPTPKPPVKAVVQANPPPIPTPES
ncbi:MAG: SPFH domain-containing protein [Fimbriimonadaceae bacterium]